MLPAPRLIIMVMASAPVFFAGALWAPLTGIGVIYVLVLVSYMVVDALLLPRRGSLTIERVIPERLSLGVPTSVCFEITNKTRRRVQVSLAEDLPEDMEAVTPPPVGVFDPGACGTLYYRVVARSRGRYALAGVDVRALPSMGLFYRQFRAELPAEVAVFPNLVNIDRYELLLRKGLSYEQGLARLRRIGQGSEFESLRSYIHGDEMSRVDWKATAKRSRLIVRNMEPERQQNILVALDVGRATAGEFEGMSRLDYLVNATLMLAYVVLRQGDWFSLVAFSDAIESYLPPIRRVESIERVARALHELQPKLVEADYAAACRFLGLRSRKRSFVCLLTDVIDREASSVIVEYMSRFARRHIALAVTLSNPEIGELAEEPLSRSADVYSKAVALDVMAARREALTAMRHQGVEVLDASPHALLPELINRYLQIKATRRL